MDDIQRTLRQLIILNEACLDEQMVQATVILIEKLMKLLGTIFMNNNGMLQNSMQW